MASRRHHRRRSRRHNVVRLDGDALRRHVVSAIISIQEQVEGLTAVVQLLDEIAAEIWADAEPAELRSATVMMRAALAAINENAVDIAIG